MPAGWSAAAPVQAELASATAPLEGWGWTVAAEEAGPVMGAPGMPGAAAAAKGAGAFGAGPRYGVKPIVMPKRASSEAGKRGTHVNTFEGQQFTAEP